MSERDQLLKWIEDEEEAIIGFFQEFVRRPSPNQRAAIESTLPAVLLLPAQFQRTTVAAALDVQTEWHRDRHSRHAEFKTISLRAVVAAVRGC